MANPYITYTTMLAAAWEGGVIIQPTFFNLKVQNYRPSNSIGFEFISASLEFANKGYADHHRLWPAIAKIFANSDANREKIIEQVMKHTLADKTTSIKYNIHEIMEFSERKGVWMCMINFNEGKFITTSGW